MKNIEETIAEVTMEAYPTPPPHVKNPEKLSCERRKYITREAIKRYAMQFSDDDRIKSESFSYNEKTNDCMNGEQRCGLAKK